LIAGISNFKVLGKKNGIGRKISTYTMAFEMLIDLAFIFGE
jgi:hypothetical protein